MSASETSRSRSRSRSEARSESAEGQGAGGYLSRSKGRIAAFYGRVVAEKYTDDDFYLLSFATDFVCFVYTIFIWGAFRRDDGSSTSFLTFLLSNRIPVVFIVVLLLQFLLILANRYIYLKGSIVAKLVYHTAVCLGFHALLFVYVPQTTRKPFAASTELRIFYCFRLVSLGLGALQIRYGYPVRRSGEALTKRATPLMGKLFGAYRAIPFVYELRVLLDWICTPTTLEFYQWLKVEDIWASVFLVKCALLARAARGREHGAPQAAGAKYGTGCVLFAFVILLLWVPLFIFSSANPALAANPLESVDLSFRIDALAPIYSASLSIYATDLAPDTAIFPLSPAGTNFTAIAAANPGIVSVGDYARNVVQVASAPLLSPARPPHPSALNASLPLHNLHVALALTRLKNQDGRVVHLRFNRLLDPAQSAALAAGAPITLPALLPRFVALSAGPTPLDLPPHRFIDVTIHPSADPNVPWRVAQVPDPLYWDAIRASGDRIIIVVVSEQLPDQVLAVVGGLLGVYVGVVLAIGRMLRSYVSGLAHTIMFEDLEPSPDGILRVVSDIVDVRGAGELAMEEELYSELIELYRSPEAIIARTRS